MIKKAVFLTLELACFVAWAERAVADSSSALAACQVVYNNNIRSLYATSSSETKYFSVYDAYCDSSGNFTKSDSDQSLSVVVEDLPLGYQGSGSSISQNFHNFCRDFHQLRLSGATVSTASSAPIEAGFSDFNECLKIASHNVEIEPLVTDEYVDLTVDPSGKTIQVLAIDAGSALSCTSSTLPSGPKLDRNTHAAISHSFSIDCKRKLETRKSKGNGSMTASLSSSIILAMDVGNYKLIVPDSELASYVDGRQTRALILQLQGSLADANSQISAANLSLQKANDALSGERSRIASIKIAAGGSYRGQNKIDAYKGFSWTTTGYADAATFDRLGKENCSSKLNGPVTNVSSSVEVGGSAGNCCGYEARTYACMSLPPEPPVAASLAKAAFAKIDLIADPVATVAHSYQPPKRSGKKR